MGTFYDREIEYLESTGSQYIDPQYVTKENTIVILVAQLTSLEAQDRIIGNNSGYFEIYINGSTKWAFASNGSLVSSGTSADLNKHTFRIDNVALKGYIDSSSWTISKNTSSYYNSTGIFARANGIGCCTGKIYSAQIYEGDTLIRDFVPVRVGTTGYLFDRVSCQLFGNAGTGSFVLGPDMYDARVEYVGTRGLGKAFPTGYIPTGTDIVIDMSVKFQGFTAKTGAFFYTWNSDTTTECYCLWRNGTTNNQLTIRCGNKQSQASTVTYTLSTGTTYNFRAKWGQAAINYGTYTINTTAATNQNPSFLYLSTANTEQGINQDIYYFKVYKAGVLVCDLIPVRKGQTPCVYDRVTNRTFEGYGNGTGSLVMGNDVPDIPSDYDAEVDYIVFDGSQSIDTGLYGDLNTDVKVTLKPNAKNVNIFGSYPDATNLIWLGFNVYGRYWSEFQNSTDGNGALKLDNGNYDYWAELIANKDLRQIKLLNKANFISNTTALTTTFNTLNTLKIGGWNGNSVVPTYKPFIGYMGPIQIKENNVLVRDYVPVRKNGKGYLYDRVTHKMFGNEFGSSFEVGMDKIKPSPIVPLSDGISRYFSRRQLLHMYAEQDYNCVNSWQSNDTNTSTKAQLYHGQRYKYEDAWGDISGTNFTFWATSYTGRHKTLNVVAGQKYRIKANSSQATVLVFCNDHVWTSRKKLTGIRSITVQVGVEQIITVPSGYAYMMIRAATSSGSTLTLPDRITRLVAYG